MVYFCFSDDLTHLTIDLHFLLFWKKSKKYQTFIFRIHLTFQSIQTRQTSVMSAKDPHYFPQPSARALARFRTSLSSIPSDCASTSPFASRRTTLLSKHKHTAKHEFWQFLCGKMTFAKHLQCFSCVSVHWCESSCPVWAPPHQTILHQKK